MGYTSPAIKLAEAEKEIRRLRGELTKQIRSKWQLEADMKALRVATAEERECELMALVGQLNERIEQLEEECSGLRQGLVQALTTRMHGLLSEQMARVEAAISDVLHEYEDADRLHYEPQGAQTAPPTLPTPGGGRHKLTRDEVLGLHNGEKAWAVFTRLWDSGPKVEDEGPVTLHILFSDRDIQNRRIPDDQQQRAIVLSTGWGGWADYNMRTDLRDDGSLLAEDYLLELYRDEG